MNIPNYFVGVDVNVLNNMLHEIQDSLNNALSLDLKSSVQNRDIWVAESAYTLSEAFAQNESKINDTLAKLDKFSNSLGLVKEVQEIQKIMRNLANEVKALESRYNSESNQIVRQELRKRIDERKNEINSMNNRVTAMVNDIRSLLGVDASVGSSSNIYISIPASVIPSSSGSSGSSWNTSSGGGASSYIPSKQGGTKTTSTSGSNAKSTGTAAKPATSSVNAKKPATATKTTTSSVNAKKPATAVKTTKTPAKTEIVRKPAVISPKFYEERAKQESKKSSRPVIAGVFGGGHT